MLRYKLLHPQILQALASAGHGSQVLIADGNYPVATLTPPHCTRVFLNLAPGMVRVTDVLEVLLGAIAVEDVILMQPDDGSTPPILPDVERLVQGVPIKKVERFEFYSAAGRPSVSLAIATGEERLYANVLLTIGVVR